MTVERDNILDIMEIKEEELVPLTDDLISSVCQNIHDCFPKVKKKRLFPSPNSTFRKYVAYKSQRNTRNDTVTSFTNTRML
jgi:hypothetical protein